MELCSKAKSVAAFLLQRDYQEESDEHITQLKLQKLLYYAQGLYLALSGKCLFDEKIHAWNHGPVVVSVYSDFEKGRNPLTLYPNNDQLVDKLSDEEQQIIDFAYFVYGRYGAWQLRNMTHSELPWLNSRTASRIISQEDIKSFFENEIRNSDTFALRHSTSDEELEDISDILDYLKSNYDSQETLTHVELKKELDL